MFESTLTWWVLSFFIREGCVVCVSVFVCVCDQNGHDLTWWEQKPKEGSLITFWLENTLRNLRLYLLSLIRVCTYVIVDGGREMWFLFCLIVRFYILNVLLHSVVMFGCFVNHIWGKGVTLNSKPYCLYFCSQTHHSALTSAKFCQLLWETMLYILWLSQCMFFTHLHTLQLYFTVPSEEILKVS